MNDILKDFLLKDYELKTEFLMQHYRSLWFRFNIMLTLEILVTSAVLLQHKDNTAEFVLIVSVIGLYVSVIWAMFCYRDSDLVDFHQRQLRRSSVALRKFVRLKGDLPKSFKFTLAFPGQRKTARCITATCVSQYAAYSSVVIWFLVFAVSLVRICIRPPW